MKFITIAFALWGGVALAFVVLVGGWLLLIDRKCTRDEFGEQGD